MSKNAQICGNYQVCSSPVSYLLYFNEIVWVGFTKLSKFLRTWNSSYLLLMYLNNFYRLPQVLHNIGINLIFDFAEYSLKFGQKNRLPEGLCPG